MITFEKLRWKNFLSTGNLFTEIDLLSTSLTLIVGENGAGKSTMLDALTFALFGRAFRNINKPQLVNSITRKHAVVEIEFKMGPNRYKIIRGIAPTLLEVYQNDRLLNQSADVKDYQEVLEKQILKINYKSFCQVVVLGSASFVPFMQLSAMHRREIIEDLLDLQIFTSMNVLLKDKTSKNAESIQAAAFEKEMCAEKSKLIREHAAASTANVAKILEDKRDRVVAAWAEIDSHNAIISNMEAELAELRKQVADEQTLVDRYNALARMDSKLEEKRNSLRRDHDFFHDNSDCPTCKQVIDEAFKEGIIEKRLASMVEVDTARDKLKIEWSVLENKLAEYQRIHKEIRAREHTASTHQHQADSRKKYVAELQDEMNALQLFQDDQDSAKKLAELDAEMAKLTVKEAELAAKKHVYAAASTLLKDGGIKAKIIKQYIPVINKLINKYLAEFDFFVQFELSEEFKETIKSRFRDDFSYASFSEGEKMKINLAILFTWRAIAKMRNSISTNLLIMDEVFDSSLDSNGTDEFMKILNGLAEGNNTFIISHKTDSMVDKFKSVIRFEKKQNFSRVAA